MFAGRASWRKGHALKVKHPCGTIRASVGLCARLRGGGDTRTRAQQDSDLVCFSSPRAIYGGTFVLGGSLGLLGQVPAVPFHNHGEVDITTITPFLPTELR